MSTNAVDLAIRMTADASDVEAAFDGVGSSALAMGDDVERASRTAESATGRLDGVADAADNMGSKSSQAAGGLGDLGGALSMMPGPLGAVGAGMEAVAPAIMGVTGAMDLVNLATSSNIVLTARARVATIAHAVASRITAVAIRVMAAAQWAMNAAMAANPVGLVVLAVIALIAVVVIAYKKSETFRNIVQGAMRAATTAVGWVVDKVSDLVSWIRDKAVAAWDRLKEAAVNAAEWIADKVGGAFDAATAPVQWLIDKVQDLLGLISDIKIPGMGDAEGNGTLVGGGFTPKAGKTVLPSQLSSASGAPTVDARTYVTVDGSGIVDENAVARTIEQALARRSTRLGGVVFA
jgi:hypothetical protein